MKSSRDETSENTANDTHQLFPPEKDTDNPADIQYIIVQRYEGGNRVTCPYIFPADELPTIQALYGLFGGGKYELIGRDGNRQKITGRKSLTLPGKPKPLFNVGGLQEAVDEEESEASDPLDSPVARASATAPLMNSLPAILGTLGPLLIAYMQGQQQMRLAESQTQATMFQSLLAQSNQSSREFIQSMQAMHQAQTAQMATILAAKDSGDRTGGDGNFTDGIEWFQEFMAGQKEAMAEKEGGDKTFEQVMQGLQMLRAMQGPPQVPPTDNGAPA